MTVERTPLVGGRDPSLYRPNVGLAMFSRKGFIFIGRRAVVRKDDTRFAWQMPQGGIDRGEQPRDAAFRELEEETGVGRRHVELLDEIEEWLYYDFPPALKARLSGPYVGQRQKWFAFRFLGGESDIRLDQHTPEFDAWRWEQLERTPDLVIPFKQGVYREVSQRFSRWADVAPPSPRQGDG
jgi:putative (di)nucleoside polyphosphate hydrolase